MATDNNRGDDHGERVIHLRTAAAVQPAAADEDFDNDQYDPEATTYRMRVECANCEFRGVGTFPKGKAIGIHSEAVCPRCGYYSKLRAVGKRAEHARICTIVERLLEAKIPLAPAIMRPLMELYLRILRLRNPDLQLQAVVTANAAATRDAMQAVHRELATTLATDVQREQAATDHMRYTFDEMLIDSPTGRRRVDPWGPSQHTVTPPIPSNVTTAAIQEAIANSEASPIFAVDSATGIPDASTRTPAPAVPVPTRDAINAAIRDTTVSVTQEEINSIQRAAASLMAMPDIAADTHDTGHVMATDCTSRSVVQCSHCGRRIGQLHTDSCPSHNVLHYDVTPADCERATDPRPIVSEIPGPSGVSNLSSSVLRCRCCGQVIGSYHVGACDLRDESAPQVIAVDCIGPPTVRIVDRCRLCNRPYGHRHFIGCPLRGNGLLVDMHACRQAEDANPEAIQTPDETTAYGETQGSPNPDPSHTPNSQQP